MRPAPSPANDRAPARRVLIKDIIRAACAECECSEERFRERSQGARRREMALPRQAAMYLARELTNRSYPYIGRCFGRDHATVIYGHHKIRDLIVTDPKVSALVTRLRARLPK